MEYLQIWKHQKWFKISWENAANSNLNLCDLVLNVNLGHNNNRNREL